MKNDKIAILVDSGTDVPEELIKKYEMYMIPLKIIYKDQVYTDKIDITPEEIYQRLPEEIPGTSLPDGESITEIFEQIKKDGYEVTWKDMFLREIVGATFLEGGIVITATYLRKIISLFGFASIVTPLQYIAYALTIASILYAYFQPLSMSFHDKIAKTVVIKKN